IFLFFLTVLVGGLLIERAGIKPFTLRAAQLGLCTVLPLICAIWYVWPRLQNEGTRPMLVLPLRVLRRAAKNLMMLSIDNFSGAQVWSALLFGCLLLILVLVSGLMGYVGRSRLKELSHFERWLLCSTALLVLVYFLVPDQWGEIGLVKLRMPVVIVLVLLPVIRISYFDRGRRFALGAIACVVVVCVASNFY